MVSLLLALQSTQKDYPKESLPFGQVKIPLWCFRRNKVKAASSKYPTNMLHSFQTPPPEPQHVALFCGAGGGGSEGGGCAIYEYYSLKLE